MAENDPQHLSTTSEKDVSGLDFIRETIVRDLQAGKFGQSVRTRFPPEPNGYLHIGHAKSICLNFGIAEEFPGATCNLRFDDTDPSKETPEYVESIKDDVQWLGFDVQERMHFASDYFEQMYDFACELIKAGKAYVDSLTPEQIREYRGTLTEPGTESPYRDRPVNESLDLFERMRAGEFEEGAHVLRAKIDMASANLHMRDPAIYRIRHVPHHRTADQWCVYPMYDFAHCLSDSLEGITHSLCTLEFEIHRPLYDWILDQLDVHHPQQIEFAPLSLTYTVLSKRRLTELVEDGTVDGWDDPRMPTIAGFKRRGYTPESIRDFCHRVGVTKFTAQTEMALLEHCIREDLNKRAQRVMAVLHPLKVVIENYPEDMVEQLEAVNNPEDFSMGSRQVPFSKVIYVEQNDFREDPPRKYHRLAPGREVRLRYGYFITCHDYVKDEKTGEIKELRCTYDPETRGGHAPDGRKVKGTIQWVSGAHAIDAQVRLYDRLFMTPDPTNVEQNEDFRKNVNPESLTCVAAKVEPALKYAKPGDRFQFERQGYFCVDPDTNEQNGLIFNRTVSLKDTWAKIEKSQKSNAKAGGQ